MSCVGFWLNSCFEKYSTAHQSEMASERNKGHREDGKKSQWDGDKIKGTPGPTEGMEMGGR